MRHLKQVLAQKHLRHIKHPVVKVHTRIIGKGSPVHKKDLVGKGFGPERGVRGPFGPERGVRGPLAPLKFKF